jgi:GDP-L-fucose synthase
MIQNAQEVVVWGTGTPLREFMHVDDLAEACLFLMERFDEPGFINVGTGKELSIRELAELIATIVGYSGKIVFDTTKPDGTPRKLMDVGRMTSMGWHARIPLKEGLQSAYKDAGFSS